MTRIAICGAKGAYGVTTLACVLGAVWPVERAVVVAECDPSGGDLAGRFGLSTRVGMTSLVLTERQQATVPEHRSHVQQLPGGLDVLIGPVGADAAASLDRELGVSSSDIVGSHTDLLADCGRLVPGAVGQERIVRASDGVVLLVRPDVAGVAHARWATKRIGQLVLAGVYVAVTGTGAFTPTEVAGELGVPVVAAVPFDGRAARIAGGTPGSTREFARSSLVSVARVLACTLLDAAPRWTGPGDETAATRVIAGPEIPDEGVASIGSAPYVIAGPHRQDDRDGCHLNGADRGS